MVSVRKRMNLSPPDAGKITNKSQNTPHAKVCRFPAPKRLALSMELIVWLDDRIIFNSSNVKYADVRLLENIAELMLRSAEFTNS